VLKASIFIVDFENFAAMNEVYARHVGPDFPARATVEIAGLPSGALVEIEVLAHT
jgi:2-iminobutanoate/2-iminopropanoate deaminase